MRRSGSFSSQKAWDARRLIEQLALKAHGLAHNRYFPPEPAPPGAKRGEAALFDPSLDPPWSHWTPEQKKNILHSKILSRAAKKRGLF